MIIDIDISEIEVLLHDLGAAGPDAVREARTVVRKTGFDVVADAQALAPVDTGNLRNSIGVDFDPDGLGFTAGPTAAYAPYVEYGTSMMSPQPYMGPAFDRRVPAAAEALQQIAARVLD